jgi:hypothetical protein
MIAMIKKLMLGLVPLLAVVAFAVMPAMASANTREYGTCEIGTPQGAECPSGEKKFTAFTTTVKVLNEKAFGSGNFILTNIKTKTTIECETLISSGSMKNVGGVGMSTETLIFNHCFTLVGALKCRVSSVGAGAGVIVTTVTDEVVVGGEKVKVTLPAGGIALVFSGPPPVGCPPAGTVIGNVKGNATGSQAVASGELIFTAAPGLELNGEPSTITGSVETYTESGKLVVIN